MRAVWIGVPESFLEERHRLGHDKGDELWEGVVHMVPPPASAHGIFATQLGHALQPVANRKKLVLSSNSPGLYATADDYRVPDVLLARPEHVSKRGFEGAELAVEVLSPGDESRDKLPFYARLDVREVWLIDPATRETEILALATNRYKPVALANGLLHSTLLGVKLRTVNGTLEIHDGDDVYAI